MKICPICATSNLDSAMRCTKCNEPISTLEKVKWNDFKRINELIQAAKAGVEAPEKVLSEKERLLQLDKQGIPYCPKCHSTNVSANKKGFGIGKAVVGAVVTAPIGGVGGLIGLTAGNINAKKVRITCLKCGYNWIAGKK